MRDYAEQVKELRDFAEEFDLEDHTETAIMLANAADAIEELLAEVEHWKLEAAANETDRKYLIDENRKLVNSLMNFRVPTWISVEDELPESGQWVLVWGHGQKIPTMMFRESGAWIDDQFEFHTTITHWMPLPEPPKGVE